MKSTVTFHSSENSIVEDGTLNISTENTIKFETEDSSHLHTIPLGRNAKSIDLVFENVNTSDDIQSIIKMLTSMLPCLQNIK